MGGLWTARTPKTCLLLPGAVLRVFHETNTIFRNTRPLLNAADAARAAAFNVVQAAEAVWQASAPAPASGCSLPPVAAFTAQAAGAGVITAI